jgi:7-cyano-7-deazaguanine synthase
VLLAELAEASPRVAPVYVRLGTAWDGMEEGACRRFVGSLAAPAVGPLQVFDLPVGAVYGEHWSTTGVGVPGRDSPDDAVYMPGRNLLVLLQAAVWCSLHGIPTLALGLLSGNPFRDASPPFFASYERALNAGLGADLRIVLPYRELAKPEVLRRGRRLPLGLTWSCIRPAGRLHCGRCNKCAERQRAFAAAGLADATEYATGGAWPDGARQDHP